MNDHPQCSLLEFAALPTAVSCARLHAKHVLREWGLAALSDDVEIIVSELVTNSLKATEALERSASRRGADVPCIELQLHTDAEGRILVQVWDSNPQPPALQIPDTDELQDLQESGRGLFLVEMLSQCWGYYPTPTADPAELFALQQPLSLIPSAKPRSLRAMGKAVWAVVEASRGSRGTAGRPRQG